MIDKLFLLVVDWWVYLVDWSLGKMVWLLISCYLVGRSIDMGWLTWASNGLVVGWCIPIGGG